ncbi:MAG TPA: PD-(D/E)XK nuclease family protein [Cyclobacteriaceae bacterium]|nr:PD-(D/E)XK nuclease family protein [Cyclobacteriaceae bacterium]
MKTFLDEVAQLVLDDFSRDTGKVTVIFPNKRAGLFFTRALSHKIKKPLWSPRILSIEEFIFSLTSLKPADRLSLLLDLYQAYKKATGFEESFDRFYFWGELLLNDFDEIDKYLIDPDRIFTAVKDLKDIDAEFPFLTDEEKEIITKFWGSLSGMRSGYKEGFLRFWHSLPAIYKNFSQILDRGGYTTQGRVYREIAGQILNDRFSWNGGPVIFAGFNALTSSEEVIMKWFVSRKKGIILWDTDGSYLDNPLHEAGVFHRKYLKDKILGSTFPKQVPIGIAGNSKEIEVISTSSGSAQVQWMGRKLQELAESGMLDAPEKTVIVLPEESLVASVLFAIPEVIQKLNITIAYPVRTTPLYSFFELLADLQVSKREGSRETWFSHRQVIPLLSHPVVSASMPAEASALAGKIRKMNKILVPSKILNAGGIIAEIFRPVSDDEYVPDYLARLVLRLGDTGSAFDKEIRFYFFRLFKRIGDVFEKKDMRLTFPMLKSILRQLSRIERVSFSGEPLEGLQVMGILETRNLDFENVIILDMNEGSFPRQPAHNSFIPYHVRWAFRLPNFEHTSSMFAYHFYRLFQRSKNIWLVYNSEETGLNPGEPSRFIQQLKYESGLKVKWTVLVQKIRVVPDQPAEVPKSEDIMERLSRYTDRGREVDKYLTPSALNTYLDCPLTFYYKYVMDVKEIEEIKPEFDALLFGNILHKAMEELYKPVFSGDGTLITSNIIQSIRKDIPKAVERSFGFHFGRQEEDEVFRFEGRNILGKEIIEKLMGRILQVDEQYAPFKIIGSEIKVVHKFPVTYNGITREIAVKGIIDRIDEKDGHIRIVDYKSGRDKRQFESVEALFSDDFPKRNKAVFQVLFYTMILEEQQKYPVVPALYNAQEIYRDDFDPMIRMGKGARFLIPDADQIKKDILPQFRDKVSSLIREIFDPAIPFRHQEKERPCTFCDRAGFPS